jgi:general secretion pathway protein B
MSYILDALKKSEQERGRGTAPSVQTLHSAGSHYPASKTHMWPYLLLAAIAINLALLLYFILADADVDQSVQPRQVSVETARLESDITQLTATRQVAELPAAETADEIVYKPVLLPANRRALAIENSNKAEFAPTPAQLSTPRQVVPQRDELPADIQQHIPFMEFSAHVYSSNPLHRSIVINGRFMEEGDMFASDLLLSEITPKGAIFDFQGQLFHQNVVSAWN